MSIFDLPFIYFFRTDPSAARMHFYFPIKLRPSTKKICFEICILRIVLPPYLGEALPSSTLFRCLRSLCMGNSKVRRSFEVTVQETISSPYVLEVGTLLCTSEWGKYSMFLNCTQEQSRVELSRSLCLMGPHRSGKSKFSKIMPLPRGGIGG